VEVIDFAGPYEVFLNASAANHSYFNVFTVAATDKEIETAGNLTIKPKYRFDNHPKIDILVLPGGGVLKARSNPEVIKWIQKTAKDAEIVMSVCNGAGFLAKAGLLDGKEVTTVAGGIEGLQREGRRLRSSLASGLWIAAKLSRVAGSLPESTGRCTLSRRHWARVGGK
jgi:transcriptional regulator GlxA family with amidase domain